MGNTCKSMADSFQYMTKPTTIKKKRKKIFMCILYLYIIIFTYTLYLYIIIFIYIHMWDSLMAQWVRNLPAIQETQETQIRSPGQGDSPVEENGNPPQYSCLENSMDRVA